MKGGGTGWSGNRSLTVAALIGAATGYPLGRERFPELPIKSMRSADSATVCDDPHTA
jgi:hypothetical protein